MTISGGQNLRRRRSRGLRTPLHLELQLQLLALPWQPLSSWRKEGAQRSRASLFWRHE
jgi:hypothetical protein